METTLEAVIDRIQTDFEFATGESPTINNVVDALINNYGYATHSIYRYLDNRLLQLFPQTADEDWLEMWGERTQTPRLDGESVENWRIRIIAQLNDRQRFGTTDDLVFWAKEHQGVFSAFVHSNYPFAGQTTLVVVADELSANDIAFIKNDISGKMHAGSELTILKSQPQHIDITISGVSAEHQNNISIALGELFNASWEKQNAIITLAKIHDAIATITTEYTLVSPNSHIIANSNFHLLLRQVIWQ